MKYNKIILFGLLLLSILLPFVSVAHAADIPSYVGVKAGQTYVWDTEFDAGPMEDYYEDRGETDEKEIEEDAWEDLEFFEWEEEVTQWKLNIYDISEAKEMNFTDPDYPAYFRDDYTYVRIDYTLKEYDGDVGYWRRIDTYKTGYLFESDELFWAYVLLFYRWGPEFATRKGDLWFPALIVPKDIDWDQVARDYLDIEDIKYSRKQEYYSVDEVEIQYFQGRKHVGIKTEYDPVYRYPQYEKDLETFESISKYNDDGVLYYYEFTYDGDIIAKLELKGIFGPYFIENWWWMAIVAGAVVVGVIIVIVVIVKIVKKRK